MKGFEEYIPVASISQQKESTKFAKTLFTKGKRVGNIRSFGIITAENPDGERQSGAENKNRQQDFAKQLKASRYVYIQVEGRYKDNKEHPYLIFNITRDVLRSFAKKYWQECYVYVELETDGTMSTFECWEKEKKGVYPNAAKNPYVKTDEAVEWTKRNDATDIYTVIGKDLKLKRSSCV